MENEIKHVFIEAVVVALARFSAYVLLIEKK